MFKYCMFKFAGFQAFSSLLEHRNYTLSLMSLELKYSEEILMKLLINEIKFNSLTNDSVYAIFDYN